MMGGIIMTRTEILKLIKEMEYSLDYYKRDYETYKRARDVIAIEYLEEKIKEYRSKIED